MLLCPSYHVFGFHVETEGFDLVVGSSVPQKVGEDFQVK